MLHKNTKNGWMNGGKIRKMLKAELKARVLNRVTKGSVPNVNSMAKYDITLEEINLLRAEYGFEPLIINVPMFLRERDCGDIEGRTADNIPARSEVIDDIDRGEDEVEQRSRPTPESVRRETEDLERRRRTAEKVRRIRQRSTYSCDSTPQSPARHGASPSKNRPSTSSTAAKIRTRIRACSRGLWRI